MTIEINMIVIFTYAIISSDAKELFLWVDVSLLLTRFSSEIWNSEFRVCILLRVKQTHYALKIILRSTLSVFGRMKNERNKFYNLPVSTSVGTQCFLS